MDKIIILGEVDYWESTSVPCAYQADTYGTKLYPWPQIIYKIKKNLARVAWTRIPIILEEWGREIAWLSLRSLKSAWEEI